MLHVPFESAQQAVVIALAGARPAWMESVLYGLNFFDSKAGYLLGITLLWFGLSSRWGIRSFYWFALNATVVDFLKNFFGWPRPSVQIPEFSLLHPQSYSFPSGGAHMYMFIGIMLIYYGRRWPCWALGLALMACVSLSRVYLGVHYPLDVLGGWLSGSLMALLCIMLTPRVERFASDYPAFWRVVMGAGLFFILALCIDTSRAWQLSFATLGVSAGHYLFSCWQGGLPDPQRPLERIGRVGVAMLLMFTALQLFSAPGWIAPLCIGALLSVLAPWMSVRMFPGKG